MAQIRISAVRLTVAAQDAFDGWLNDVAKPGIDYQATLDECQKTMLNRFMAGSPLVYELPGRMTFSGNPSQFRLNATQIDIETSAT